MPDTMHTYGRPLFTFELVHSMLIKSSANVFAAEMFDHNFARNPESRTAWERFRNGVLQWGGSRDEGEVIEEFLGRKPSPVALLRSMGVDPIANPKTRSF